MKERKMERFCLNLMREKPSAEARAWLETCRGCNIGELSPAQTRRYVGALYASGAQQVYAVSLSSHAGAQSTNSLVVCLPKTGKAREVCRELCEGLLQQRGYSLGADDGSDYLFLWPIKGAFPAKLFKAASEKLSDLEDEEDPLPG